MTSCFAPTVRTMSLQSLFGIELPVIQAPMAGVQGSGLAISVTDAGGLGSLPCAMLGADALGSELAVLHARGGPFNVNFFCHVMPVPDPRREAAWRTVFADHYQAFGIDPDTAAPMPVRQPFDAAAAELLAEFRPAVVSFHFGLPKPALLDRVRACGAKIISSATTVDEARWLEARGVDAIIAQGVEAGGHRGMFLSDDLTTQVGTFALLPQIVRSVRVPVIAAGGIADAAGVAAAMALGAAGVQVGTTYLRCPEADTTPIHRAQLASDSARHTALTNLFTGRPARSIVNTFIRESGPINAAAPAFPLAAAAVAPLRRAAEALGSGDFSPLWAGQNVAGCREIPAGDLTRQLAGS